MPIHRLDAQEAWATFRINKTAWWPSKDRDPERLIPVAKPAITNEISLVRGESIFTVGSCFARNIEEHLAKIGFHVPCLKFAVPKSEWKHRPSGILNKYNPFSMLYELEWGIGARKFPYEKGFVNVGTDQWLDLQLPYGAAPVTLERVIERRREIENLFSLVTDCSKLVLTLGLVEAWWDNELELYTNSTIPREVATTFPGRFELHVLSYNDVLNCLVRLVELVGTAVPKIGQVLLSVSPVPLTATFTNSDVLVANSYSKSVLRAVVDEVRANHPDVAYFPSYESVILSDRQTAWQDDLIHVTDSLVGFNVGRLNEFVTD